MSALNRCVQYLCLRQNLIKTIEGLGTLVQLQTLDLRDNLLERIEGLDNLVNLTCVANRRHRVDFIDHAFQLPGPVVQLHSRHRGPAESDAADQAIPGQQQDHKDCRRQWLPAP